VPDTLKTLQLFDDSKIIKDTDNRQQRRGKIEDFRKSKYFTVKYGVISRHYNKDPDHNLTADDWINLSKEIVRPFAISLYYKKGVLSGYRFFTRAKINNKWLIAGIDVKNIQDGIELLGINAVQTSFGYNGKVKNIPYLIWKETPGQR
jgi:hypothetical protein